MKPPIISCGVGHCHACAHACDFETGGGVHELSCAATCEARSASGIDIESGGLPIPEHAATPHAVFRFRAEAQNGNDVPDGCQGGSRGVFISRGERVERIEQSVEEFGMSFFGCSAE